ncbi:MAG: hypothetical protein M3285_11905 [Actinomycetota bacterium]|nr:hypothetical protein [Actinomycetota bacterium]
MPDPTRDIPLHRSVDPDDIVDFHAARVLILLEVCGAGERTRRIDGRTKLAKLDFFLRYPRFLHEAHRELGISHPSRSKSARPELEAPMIRYRYGPWDPNYPNYLAFLESRGLLRVVGTDVEGYSLTRTGRQVAAELMRRPAFASIVSRAQSMLGNLSEWNGSQLKTFIYQRFSEEVEGLEFREVISP